MPNSKTKSSFMLNVENWFRYRRFPYPKRSIEFVALIAVSCTFFLFMHTKNLNSKLHEMEIKLQPSELSALGLSGSNSIINDDAKHHDLKGLHSTYQYLKSTGQIKHVNANLLNNTKNAEVDIVVFNRVPKVGSQSLMQLIVKLAKLNGFTTARNKAAENEDILLSKPLQEDLIEQISDIHKPAVYSKHIAFLNFTEFDYERPIYINLVRDPIERLVSWFYYIRAPWYLVERKKLFKNLDLPESNWIKKNFEDCVKKNDPECNYPQEVTDHNMDHRRQVLFFCGQDQNSCLPFNSFKAMQRAKYTVEKHYAVVGSWEDTNVTLTVLENYIPRFFKGARIVYNLMKHKISEINKNFFKPPVSEQVKDILRKNLTNEIEFYQFCKQRLYQQYIAIQLDRENNNKN